MNYFIINPAAGSGKPLRAVPHIEAYMKKSNLPYTIMYTKRPQDAGHLAQQAIADASRIISVGGDGTVQEIIPALIGSGIPLGIIPAGSGNDLYCSINKSKKLPRFGQLINYCLDRIFATPNTTHIDVIKANGDYFINIGSIGIDAEIVNYASSLKKRFGRAAYIASTIKTSLTYNALDMRVTAGPKTISGKTTLTAICNGTYYGGGFKICPQAQMDDSLITVCHIRRLPKLKILLLFPAVILGRHTRFKEIEFFSCKSLTVEFGGSQTLNLDGNLSFVPHKITFSIVPRAVKVFL